MLGLLESVERGGDQSQRRLASELGVALGLVNAYLKRCVSKGLVKVRSAPTRRYAYYLTPRGFAEKSRLTVEYLSYSLSLFRQAKNDCMVAFEAARARELTRLAILGASELAEIAAICAIESGVTITAVVDPRSNAERVVGVPRVSSFDEVAATDAVFVADPNAPRIAVDEAVSKFGAGRIFAPALIGWKISHNGKGAA
jgi:DNA-binding MarR family transcriptional regulator